MTKEEFAVITNISTTLENIASQVNAMEFVLFAATQELEERLPGFRHSCLERVSEVLAQLPAASGKGLDVRQRSMQYAEDMLRK